MEPQTREQPVPSAAPTVREAMTFGGLARTQLLAGGRGLDRQIGWIRVMETPETARLVQPGELFLTTLFAIKDDPDALAELVERLAVAGAAGLVVKPGRYVPEVPPGMGAQADRVALPLLLAGDDVSWVDLMAPLLERIINAEHWRLKRSMEIHRRFTELVLDGKGIDEICRTLAEILDSAVSVEDASFHLLGHAGQARGDTHRRETIARHGTPHRVLYDPLIQQTLRQVEANRGPLKVPAFPHLGMKRERIIAPITASNQVLGYISVLDHPPRNEELAFMAVEQAAIVLALALTKERALAEVEERVGGELLDDLVHGTYGDDTSAQRRARHVGYPLAGRHVVLVADIDDFRGFLKGRHLSEEAIQALKREFARRVSAPIRAFHQRALIGARSDMVIALIPVGSELEPRKLRQLAESVRDTVSTWQPGFTISVAHSAAVSAPEGISAAFRESHSVLEALARFGRRERIVAVPELGLTGLLASVGDDRLLEYAHRHLGPLAEHDAARKSELLETLRAYLETGEQLGAAKRLGIHPNTLRYRLDRIREIGRVDLEDADTRLNLAVALRVRTLLGL